MIAYISLSTDWAMGSKYQEQYEKYALPGIIDQPDSVPKTVLYWGNIMSGMNEGMDWAMRLWPKDPPFEAIVFLHPDCQIIDPEFTAKVRRYAKDPTIGVLGVIGSIGATDMNWWDAPVKHGRVHHKEGEPGVYFDEGDHEVNTVDGMILVLLPPMFDYRWPAEVYGDGHHGYPEELAAATRRRGLRVMQIDSEVRHWTTPGFAGGKEGWDRTNDIFRRRWGPFLLSKGKQR